MSRDITILINLRRRYWILILICLIRWLRLKGFQERQVTWWSRWVCLWLLKSMITFNFFREMQILCMNLLMIMKKVQCLSQNVWESEEKIFSCWKEAFSESPGEIHGLINFRYRWTRSIDILLPESIKNWPNKLLKIMWHAWLFFQKEKEI